MKRFKTLLLVFLSLFLFMPIQAQEKIHVYLFYTNQCPFCAEEIKYLDRTYKNDERVELFYYELSDHDNLETFMAAQEILNEPSQGVPYLVIGNEVIIGFAQGITDIEIDNLINHYTTNVYSDPLGKLTNTRQENNNLPSTDSDYEKTYTIPILGEIDAQSVSLPLLASVMGVVDGFNPCAMWVLVFLISMMLGFKDRKKMWILGLTFIFTSGLIYYLFMFAWLNVASVIAQIKWIEMSIALLAVGFGVYNLYKFIKNFNQAGCEVIEGKRRNTVLAKAQNITENNKLILSLISIISLAVLINLFELMCSLGLPVVFTQILNLNNLSPLKTQMHLLIYIFFFLIDDLIVFFIAMKTLKIKAISNKYAKYSQLIGGLIMLSLGIVMLFKPEWLMLNF